MMKQAKLRVAKEILFSGRFRLPPGFSECERRFDGLFGDAILTIEGPFESLPESCSEEVPFGCEVKSFVSAVITQITDPDHWMWQWQHDGENLGAAIRMEPSAS